MPSEGSSTGAVDCYRVELDVVDTSPIGGGLALLAELLTGECSGFSARSSSLSVDQCLPRREPCRGLQAGGGD